MYAAALKHPTKDVGDDKSMIPVVMSVMIPSDLRRNVL